MENAKKAQMKIDYRTTAMTATAAAHDLSECTKLAEENGIEKKS